MDHMVRKVLTCVRIEEILAFRVSSSAPLGPVEPDARFPVREKVLTTAVTRHLHLAMYATSEAVVCIDRDGKELWRFSLDVPPEKYFSGTAECEFSYDSKIAWLYRPDQAFKGSRFTDTAIALDATSGAVLSSVNLGSSGHGATFIAEPNAEYMLLSVDEGQDGGRLYRLRLQKDDPTITLAEFELEGGAFLLDVSPDFNQFIVVGYDRFALHSYPSGDFIKAIELDDFGCDDGYYTVPWSGGYLDLSKAVVQIRGETDEGDEWNQLHLIDVDSGVPLGPCGPRTEDSEDIIVLGDGSLLDEDSEGKWYRYELNQDKS